MPKERRGRSLSSDRSRASPYPCSSSCSLQSLPLSPVERVKEWEEARCPVCMEHPHNAVLLLCSSQEKGCRPYMCDTSYRHSNCLDQFCKSFSETPSAMAPQEQTSHSSIADNTISSEAMGLNLVLERSEAGVLPTFMPTPSVPCESKVQSKLVCPLCRGQINGWVNVEPARQFMNAKERSCACETCEYSGTYSDLRKHARLVHPLVRPSEADPERQHAWRRLERERDVGDVLSTMQSALLEGGNADGLFTTDEGSLLTVFFLFRVFRPRTGSGSSWSSFSRSRGLSGLSRSRGQSRSQRRRLTLWGESYDSDTGSATREEDDGLSESMPGSWHHHERDNNAR